jgi:adenylate cyclase class 2
MTISAHRPGKLNTMLRNDPLEIEVKFHLTEVDAMRDLILAMGATACGRVFETNTRFDNGAKSLKDQGILLRLRKDDRVRLTFKSPPAVRDKDFKIRRELEVQVDSFDTCGAILEGLGFHPEQTYEKWRETLALRDTKLLIDTMPYGVFLEIEGEKTDIRHIADQLHLKWKERIVLNYLKIFEIIRREEGLPFDDVTFDNFKQTRVDIRRYLPGLYAG